MRPQEHSSFQSQRRNQRIQLSLSRDATRSLRASKAFSNNVIEHMTKPVEEFRYFPAILTPGERMAHASPCYRYDYAYSRFHVIFLTGESPQVLAEHSGFRLIAREEDGEFVNGVFERLPDFIGKGDWRRINNYFSSDGTVRYGRSELERHKCMNTPKTDPPFRNHCGELWNLSRANQVAPEKVLYID